MAIKPPEHPNPEWYPNLEDYLADMNIWWSHVAQEELPLLASVLPLMPTFWANRWYRCHPPNKGT